MKSRVLLVALFVSFLTGSVFSRSPVRGSEKVKTYYGTLQLVKDPVSLSAYLLYSEDMNKTVYKLDVPDHYVGVANHAQGRRVEVKGVLLSEASEDKRAVLKVKNMVQKMKRVPILR